MPAKSRQQYKFFKHLEENPQEAKEKGLSNKQVHEFTDDMTKKRFAKLKEKVSKKD